MSSVSEAAIVLYQQGVEASEEEKALANELNLKLLANSEGFANNEELASAADCYLQIKPCGLCLIVKDGNSFTSTHVDFADAKLNYRVQDKGKTQNIAKAVGLKGSVLPSVLDATAGLGKDAYLLASMGCELAMLERSPIVYKLLVDGIERAAKESQTIRQRIARMHLRNDDFLQSEGVMDKYDVVYLDPMFPVRSKSAKVKKEMFALQKLLGSDDESLDWLGKARTLAKKRIVVKRAKLSSFLGGEKPDINFKVSSSRYDVYLVT